MSARCLLYRGDSLSLPAPSGLTLCLPLCLSLYLPRCVSSLRGSRRAYLNSVSLRWSSGCVADSKSDRSCDTLARSSAASSASRSENCDFTNCVIGPCDTANAPPRCSAASAQLHSQPGSSAPCLSGGSDEQQAWGHTHLYVRGGASLLQHGEERCPHVGAPPVRHLAHDGAALPALTAKPHYQLSSLPTPQPPYHVSGWSSLMAGPTLQCEHGACPLLLLVQVGDVVKNMGKPAAAMCTRDAHSVRVCGMATTANRPPRRGPHTSSRPTRDGLKPPTPRAVRRVWWTVRWMVFHRHTREGGSGRGCTREVEVPWRGWGRSSHAGQHSRTAGCHATQGTSSHTGPLNWLGIEVVVKLRPPSG